MTHVLSWVALGLSGLALGYALLHAAWAKRGPGASVKPFLISPALILVLGALLTLPTRPPWSPGQTLAPGLLLGGGAVLLAALLGRPQAFSERAQDGSARFVAASAQVAAATLGIGVLLVIYPHRILDALGGYGLGAVTSGLLIAGGLRLATEDREAAEMAAAAERTTLAAITLAATTYLATDHRSVEGVREWQPLPSLLMAALAVGLAGRASLARARGPAWVHTLAAVFVPLVLIAWLAGYRLHGTPGFFRVALTGLAVYALIAWLGSTSSAPAGAPARERGLHLRADLGILASLLMLGGGALAFRDLHGYGVGLAVLAGIAVATALSAHAENKDEAARSPASLQGAITLGLLLVLYRVFAERYDYRRGVEPDFFYYYAALILGALLPAFLGDSVRRWMHASAVPEPARPVSSLLRIGLAGAGAALAPLALWLLVGERPQAAFLVGLAVGAGFLLASDGAALQAEAAGSPDVVGILIRLLSVGMALSAIQFTHLLAPLALRTRGERIGILAAIAAIALAWIAATAWRERRAGARPAVESARSP
ncbi:MAG: hypothetical protein HY320_00355 [Armatimonadetes bacterium]|nr:hypothetical protein [Armatimonadota bacterium]